MGELKQRVLKNVGYNLTNTLILKFGAFLFTIIVARLLQPELFGLYSLALTIGIIAIGLADAGVNATLIYFVSSALGKNQKSMARGYFSFLLKFKILLSVIIAISIFSLSKIISESIFHKPELTPLLKIIAVYIIFQSLFEFFKASFYAIQKLKYITITQSIFQTLKLMIVSILLILGYSVFGAITGLLISTIIATIILFIFFYKKCHFFMEEGIKKINKKRVLKYFSYLLIISLSGIFFGYVDIVMIGALLPSIEVGFYKAAQAIVFSVAALLSVTGVLLPVFTQLDEEKLKTMFQKTFHYSAMVSIPAAFGLIFISKQFIEIIYGIEYLPAAIVLIPLSLLVIVQATGSFFSNIFAAKEKLKWPAIIMIIATILNITLNYSMILAYGILGAAIATVISSYFNAISLGILARKKIGIKIQFNSILKPMVATTVMVGFLIWFNGYFGLIFPLSIIEIILATIIYFITLFLIKGIKLKQ
ncbi:flippase [archaeon]|nr:flippase [archaeon]MBT6824241.1 flippase [archaeon]MBT7106779.1 flippase [archaeon]MBT7297527.1 flippase [archaeon]